MRRREFMAALGGAAAAWPLAARAQQTIPVIGFLHSASPDRLQPPWWRFGKGLGEEGFVEGPNVVIDQRWAEDNQSAPDARRRFRGKSAVILGADGGDVSAAAAKAATTSTPTVLRRW